MYTGQQYGHQEQAFGSGTSNPSFDFSGMEGLTRGMAGLEVDEDQPMQDRNTMSGNQQHDQLGANPGFAGRMNNTQKFYNSGNSQAFGQQHAQRYDQSHAPQQSQQYVNVSGGPNNNHQWGQQAQNQDFQNYGNVHADRRANFPAGANYAQPQQQQQQQPRNDGGMGDLTNSFQHGFGFNGGRKRKKRRRKKTHKKKHKTTHKKRHKKTRAKKKHKKRKHKKTRK